MNILILGGNGLLGSEVVKYFKNVDEYETRYTQRRGDVFNFDATKNELSCLCHQFSWADYVINCIGVINKHMDKDIAESIYVNAYFPHELARYANKFSAKVIHITTDCVFFGDAGRYTEESPHDCVDKYGMSKSLGEPVDDCMVIRTSIVGRETPGQGFSFIGWLENNKGKTVNGFNNHYWNGVTTPTYANICHQIISGNLYEVGLHHVFSNDVTKYELANIVNDTLKLSMNVKFHRDIRTCDRTLRTVKPLMKSLIIPSIENQIKTL